MRQHQSNLFSDFSLESAPFEHSPLTVKDLSPFNHHYHSKGYGQAPLQPNSQVLSSGEHPKLCTGLTHGKVTETASAYALSQTFCTGNGHVDLIHIQVAMTETRLTVQMHAQSLPLWGILKY